MLERRLRPPHPVDLGLTLGPVQHGRHDPCARVSARDVWRATRTPDGPAATHVARDGDAIAARAWGPGAGWALDALPRLLGLHDDPRAFVPRHPLLAELHRTTPGMRLGASDAVVEALVASVVEQRVTSVEAHRSYRRLMRRYGEPAPGPAGRHGLLLPPEPARLAALAYWAYHPLGIERRRAETIRRVCGRAASLARVPALEPAAARRALESIPGVGPWTAAEVALGALGDPDAVSVGDYHLPNQVAWALAGERRADDERMLELLEPFRPQRGRVIRLLTTAGIGPPRRAARAPLRAIERI